MTPEANLEGTRMSHESLTLEEVLRRARRMVGNFKAEEANQVPMRPTEGCESVVRIPGLRYCYFRLSVDFADVVEAGV
jgi:hypothetical protein